MSLINMMMEASIGAPNFSAVFDAGTKTLLERTFPAPTNRRKCTLSFWLKDGPLGTESAVLAGYQLSGSTIQRIGEAKHNFGVQSPTGAGELHYDDDTVAGIVSEDCVATVQNTGSVWNHFLLSIDTTNATLADRVKVWINDTLVTDGTNACPLNADTLLNSANLHLIGARFNDVAVDYVSDIDFLTVSLAEIYFVDGQNLTPSDFVVSGSPVRPKKYAGTFGAAGFYLPFSLSTDMGKDFSGNGNDWAPHAGTVAPTQSTSNPFLF